MNSINKKLTTIILAVTFISCSDGLDLLPKDQISDASFWKTADDFKLAANRFYFGLQEPGLYDLESDLGTPSWSTNSISNGSYTPAENSSLWNNSYQNIREVNYLIQKAQEYPDQMEIAQFKAEALFFRAYNYFGLVKDYGGVPIITDPLDVSSSGLTASRDSREKVIDFILADLREAVPNLPIESEIADAEKGRVSKGAAEAFMARVALFEGTWQKYRGGSRVDDLLDIAINYSNSVINSGEYHLFDLLGDSSYHYMFIIENEQSNAGNFVKKDNREYILYNKYESEIRDFGISHSLIQKFSVTRKMADMYLCSDGLPIDKSSLYQGKSTMNSEYENRDSRMVGTLKVPNKVYYSYGGQGRKCWDCDEPGEGLGAYIPKFGNNTATGYAAHKFSTERSVANGAEGYDWPVIRYAEVLLIHAEALYERNGGISDADLDKTINLLRDRATIARLSNAFAETNGLDILEEIRRERTVELFMEDFRFDDLRRWKTAEVEMPMSIEGILYTGTEYETEMPDLDVGGRLSDGYYVWESSTNRKFENKHYLFPLPTKQIFLNPNLDQNPDW